MCGSLLIQISFNCEIFYKLTNQHLAFDAKWKDFSLREDFGVTLPPSSSVKLSRITRGGEGGGGVGRSPYENSGTYEGARIFQRDSGRLFRGRVAPSRRKVGVFSFLRPRSGRPGVPTADTRRLV